jgi:hypothetical protein
VIDVQARRVLPASASLRSEMTANMSEERLGNHRHSAELARPHLRSLLDSMFGLSADPRCQSWDGINDVDRDVLRSVMYASAHT